MSNATTTETKPSPRGRIRRIFRILGWLALGLVLLLLTLWAVAALYFDVRVAWLRTPLAVVYALAVLGVWIFVKRCWLKAVLTAGGFVLALAWWLSLQPSNDRDWQPDLVQFEYTQTAALRDAAQGLPSILVEHDITYSLYRQLAEAEPSSNSRREYELWREFETRRLTSYDAVMANLFVHHFEGDALSRLFRGIARITDCFIACEPRRARVALLGSHLVGAFGANEVTRRDAVLSVRAGFRDRELSAYWPDDDGWQLNESDARLFSHTFAAVRRGRA